MSGRGIRLARAMSALVLAGGALSACSDKGGDPMRQYGPNPWLPKPTQYLLPPMSVPRAVGWKPGETPTVAPGLRIQAMASGLMDITTIGLDLAKSVFQVHGVNASGAVAVRKTLRRSQVLPFFAKLPPCLVGMKLGQNADGATLPRRRGNRLDVSWLRRSLSWSARREESVEDQQHNGAKSRDEDIHQVAAAAKTKTTCSKAAQQAACDSDEDRDDDASRVSPRHGVTTNEGLRFGVGCRCHAR